MKQYKVGETINFYARTSGDPATDNPTATVLDETDTVEATLTIGSGLTQVGSTRIVKGSFVPDQPGAWSVHLVDDLGLDIISTYNVGDYSLTSVGANVATNEAKLDLIITQISSLGDAGGHFG